MKFAVGVRVEGVRGEFQGIRGVIWQRLKVGSQNLLLIIWSDRRESRVPTGAVRVLDDQGPNDEPVQANQNIPESEAENEDEDWSQDDMSQRSETSDGESVRDLGDIDG